MADNHKDRVEELAKSSPDELDIKVLELKEELFKLRFQHATGQLENTSALKKTGRDVARVLTIKREQELGIRETPRATVAVAEEPAEKKKGLRGRKKAAQEGEE